MPREVDSARSAGVEFNQGAGRLYLFSGDGGSPWLDVRESAAEVRALMSEPLWPVLHHYSDGAPFVVNPAHVQTIGVRQEPELW